MTTAQKDPVLVVLQLSGGNDYLNTVIPFTEPLYHDYRPTVGIPDDQVLSIGVDELKEHKRKAKKAVKKFTC